MKELLKRLKRSPKKKYPKFIAKDYDQVGTCGENVQWGFKEATGELTIIGTGEMDDYTYETPAPWIKLDIKSASIHGVTTIGYRAFYERSGLTEITIGDSVTTIGKEAFYSCSGLTKITIPDGVTTIEWE